MNSVIKYARRAVFLARQERTLVLLAALLAGGLWAFIEIADEVVEGETRKIDEAILLSLRTPGDASDPLGPWWIEEIGRDFTALGGVGVLTFITIASIVFVMFLRKYRTALFIAIAISSGIALSMTLKAGFDRPRPDLVPYGSLIDTASFPSGHSMMSALVYLTLGALLARMQPSKRLQAYLFLLAILVTTAVGVSRIYLGVHWPTDVLAGWAAGTTWAMVCWMIAALLQRYRQLEPSQDDEEEP